MQNNQVTNTNTTFLPVLNSLRGIAAIMIMLHHMTVFLLPQIYQFTKPVTPFFYNNYLWVDFFFILSGFIACHVYTNSFFEKMSRKKYVLYIVSRFARLYPLHFFVLIFFVVLEIVYLSVYHAWGPSVTNSHLPVPFTKEFSLMKLVLNLTMLNALPKWANWNGPSWAMSALWIVAFLVPFLMKIISKLRFFGNTVVLVICYLILFVLYHKFGSLDIMAAGGLVRCLSEVIIGMVGYNIYITLGHYKFLKSNGFLALCVFMAFFTMYLTLNHVITIVVFLLLVLLAANNDRESFFTKPNLLLLGDMSFAIYLVHSLPFRALDKISLIMTGSKFDSIDSPLVITIIMIFTLIFILFISFHAHKKVETPLRYWVKTKLINSRIIKDLV